MINTESLTPPLKLFMWLVLMGVSAAILLSHTVMLRDSILPENPHWVMWVVVIAVALLAMSIEVVFACLAQLSQGWFKYVAWVIVIICALMSVMANNFVMSRNETQSLAATGQGELVRSQITSLQQQVTAQNEVLAKCPPTHQKNCITPATETIAKLNEEITKLTQSLQHQVISRTQQWGQSWGKTLDLPLDVKGMFNFAISLILEITMIILSGILFLSSGKATNRSSTGDHSQSHHLHLNVDNVVISPPTVPAESTVYHVDSTKQNSSVVQVGVQSIIERIAREKGRTAQEITELARSTGIGKIAKTLQIGADRAKLIKQEVLAQQG